MMPLAKVGKSLVLSWQEATAAREAAFRSRISQELDSKLATITCDQLEAELSRQSHLLQTQGMNVIIYIHLKDLHYMPSNNTLVETLLEGSTEYTRLQDLATQEKFSGLSYTARDPASGRGFDVLLNFQLPR